MKYSKYHALGNDYLVIEPAETGQTLIPSRIRLLCDRHYGLGSDGILLGQEFLEVPPRTLTQLSINKIFGNQVTKPNPVGSLVVTSGTEFLAYLTVIDGTSQDPLFMMSR